MNLIRLSCIFLSLTWVLSLSAQQWVPYTGTIPADAVVGGTENGKPLYVGRVPFKGGIHPGKILPGGICNIGWGGKEYSFNQGFEVLVAPPNSTAWVEYKGKVPTDVVLGGYNDASKTPLYVAKHAYMGGEHPGKLWANACNIGYGGAEIVLKDKIFILVSVKPSVSMTEGFSSKGQQGQYTSWSEKWQLPVPGKSAILFKAAAKNDIHIAISDAMATIDPMYEIVIGGWGNTKSVIRRNAQGQSIQEAAGAVRKPSVADDYWVMVDKDKGTISAGYGTTAGQNVIIETKDYYFLSSVKYFAVSSWDTPIEYSNVRSMPLAGEKSAGVYVRTISEEYFPGQTVVVEYNDFPDNGSAWINIVPKNTPDTEWGNYQHTNGKSGKLEFEFVFNPGDYEVRGYFSGTDYTVKARHSFRVVSGGQ
ncbi:DUF3421 domain-containing protein [bacterium]|nr:DUF3421 domain-containing protein [bacterium]